MGTLQESSLDNTQSKNETKVRTDYRTGLARGLTNDFFQIDGFDFYSGDCTHQAQQHSHTLRP